MNDSIFDKRSLVSHSGALRFWFADPGYQPRGAFDNQRVLDVCKTLEADGCRLWAPESRPMDRP